MNGHEVTEVLQRLGALKKTVQEQYDEIIKQLMTISANLSTVMSNEEGFKGALSENVKPTPEEFIYGNETLVEFQQPIEDAGFVGQIKDRMKGVDFGFIYSDDTTSTRGARMQEASKLGVRNFGLWLDIQKGKLGEDKVTWAFESVLDEYDERFPGYKDRVKEAFEGVGYRNG